MEKSDSTSPLPYSPYGDGKPTFEVWRLHHGARAVRVYFGMDEKQGLETLKLCKNHKSETYPDADIEFHLVRAVTSYERVVPPTK